MPVVTESVSYSNLIQLFKDFRDYQTPPLVDGVYDYSVDTMREQLERLPEFRKRLEAIDTTGWTTEQKVDRLMVWAEMNGLEFDHRTLRPWERDPSFYSVMEFAESDVPAREAPRMHGTLRTYNRSYPLDEALHEEYRTKLSVIPETLSRAKETLTANTKDLFRLGILHKEHERYALRELATRVSEIHPDLVPIIETAVVAVEDFIVWLKERYNNMPDSSDGISIEEFNWSMKYVHLVPYTWEEQEAMIRRELERSWTALKLEEHRNRHLPQLTPPQTVEEYAERHKAVYPEYMKFLQDIFTVPDYMGLATYKPVSLVPEDSRDIFVQADYHNLLPLRCHMIHWLEKQRELRNTHPLRSEPMLYNIWDSRAEGFATAFEETMLQAGMMDKEPRAREVVYILLAFRAARALCDLYMHGRGWTLDQSIAQTVATTPREWLKPDGHTALIDLGLYLRQPGYGTSYVVGKLQFEQLLSDRAMQLGDSFDLKAFFDDYFTRGMIPASLIRWEMTGYDNEIKEMLE